MKTKKIKNIFYKLFNIYVILFFIFSFTLFIEISKNIFNLKLEDSLFALSFLQLTTKKIWVLFTCGLYHNNWLYFLICFLPLGYFISKLRTWYSKYEMGRFYIFSYLAGILAHIILAPEDYMIYGALGQTFAFFLLYARLYGRTILFRIFNFNLNISFVAILFIILDFLTIGMQFRHSKSSFASHLGIFIFFIIYVYIDKERTKSNSSYSYDNYQKKEPSEPEITPKYENNNAPSEHEIDLILDKISQNGIHSITEEERRKLKTASKKVK